MSRRRASPPRDEDASRSILLRTLQVLKEMTRQKINRMAPPVRLGHSRASITN